MSLHFVKTGSGEDGDGCADEVEREDPEAQSIDDHRRELPIVCLLFAFQIVFDLLRDVAQLVEYRQQLTAHARRRHRAISISGGQRRRLSPVERSLEARGTALHHVVVDWDGVVDVLDVGNEADGGRSFGLEVAHARFAL